jgi:hypothetical protein
MSTETTQVILSLLQPDQTDIMLPDGAQLQIIDSLSDIVRAGSTLVKKFQYAALIRDEQILLIWHDEIDKILLQASNVEEKLLGLVSLSNYSGLLIKHLFFASASSITEDGHV